MWLLLAQASLAAAAPTYLSCQWGEVSEGSRVELAIDEGNQRITIARPDYEVVVLPALFSPDEVRATERIGTETMTWTIGRTDLILKIGTSFSSTPRTRACEIKPTPAERAF